MNPKLERLAASDIQLIPALEIRTHFLLARDNFGALVERKGDDFGRPGAAGLLTEKGLALLVWRPEGAMFVARGFEQSATPEQVEDLRRFQRDLETALA